MTLGPDKEHETYQSMAADERHLGRDRIKQLAKGLLVVLDGGNVYGNPANEDITDEPEHLQWTEDQKRVIDAVKDRLHSMDGCRILVTGAAGTGKSAVLGEICRMVKKERFEPIRLAPSGVAAVNIGGQTLHRWFRNKDGWP